MADQEATKERKECCYFSIIPIEVTEEILSYLSSYGELQQAKRVCKTWHSLANRIYQQRQRYFYESVCRGRLCFRVVQQKSRITPSQRFSHSSCIVGKSMYIFGGCSTSNTAFNDVYELNLTDLKWTKLVLSSIPPPPKECATMVVHNKRIIIFGGWCQPSRMGIVSNAKFYNGVHVLNTDTLSWSTLNSKDCPQPCERAGHAACVVQDHMVMFGGAQRQTRFNDAWMLDLSQMCWTMPQITGKRPAGRFGHSLMKVNPYTVLLLGGCGGPNMLFSDVWLLHLKTMTWSEITVKNTEFEAPQLWCHPALNILDRIIVFSTPKTHPTSPNDGDPQDGPDNRGHRSPGPSPVSSTRMQMYTLDCSQLMTDSCCRWQRTVEAYHAPVATSLHSVVEGKGEIFIFGGIHYTSRLHTSQTVVNTLVRVTPCL